MQGLSLLRSNTVIGAIIIALGKLLEVPELHDYSPYINGLALILQGVGFIWAAVGARRAIAKAAQGVVQLNVVTVLLAVVIAPAAVFMTAPPPSMRPAVALPAYDESAGFCDFISPTGEFSCFGAVGDSLKYVIVWKQPADTGLKGPVDSTVLTFKSSAPVTFYGATGVVAANTQVRRKFGGARLADSLKLARPTTVGDSTTFQVPTFSQCRKNECSLPSSMAWHYREGWAPPPNSSLQVKGPVTF